MADLHVDDSLPARSSATGRQAAPVLPHRERDGAIRRLAAVQHGVVARRQLVEAGVPVHAIDARVRSGALVGLHRGVYRAGPVAGAWAREWAAVLASGAGAALSHQSAGRVWGLLAVRPGADVHVTTGTVQRLPGRGIRTHRAVLRGGEQTRRAGLPVTSVARTLLDLALPAGPRELEQAVAAAFRLRLATKITLSQAVAARRGRPGTATLRRLLERDAEPAFTRSEAEERFLGLVRRGGLPAPRTNARLEGYEVDFVWRRAQLVVEVDGFAFHGSRGAFDRDRRRDRVLQAAGYRVVRVTWTDLTDRAEEVLVRVAQALGRGGR